MLFVSTRTYQSETVELDDTHFSDCEFIDCVLEYRGGLVTLQSCRLRNCNYLLTEAALRTAELMHALDLTPRALNTHASLN